MYLLHNYIFSNSFDSLLGKSADVECIDIKSWQKLY